MYTVDSESYQAYINSIPNAKNLQISSQIRFHD